MSAVKAAPVDHSPLLTQLVDAGRAAGFRLETFGEIAGWPLFALTKRTPGPRPRIYLSAGIHGDEEAPSRAVLSMIGSGVFDARADWFLCPLLSPTGLARGTRENAEGIDLNRDYKDRRSAEIRAHIGWLERQPRFDLTICLHEDWEATGFYLYELNRENRPSLASAMLEAVLPICPLDHSPLIDGREAKAGIINPVGDPLLRESWPEAIYLHVQHSALVYTLESPSGLPLETRIAALGAATSAAVTALRR